MSKRRVENYWWLITQARCRTDASFPTCRSDWPSNPPGHCSQTNPLRYTNALRCWSRCSTRPEYDERSTHSAFQHSAVKPLPAPTFKLADAGTIMLPEVPLKLSAWPTSPGL